MHLNHCYAIRYTNVWIRCTCPEKRQLKDQSWQQVQIWSNSRTIFQQSFSAAAGSFNFILFQHRPTQLTNPFRCQSEPFYEVHINVQWTLSTPKKSPKDAKNASWTKVLFSCYLWKSFRSRALDGLEGPGLPLSKVQVCHIQLFPGPGLPDPGPALTSSLPAMVHSLQSSKPSGDGLTFSGCWSLWSQCF